MNRGKIGTMDAASTFDDEAYLDLVEGLRVFALTKLARTFRRRAAETLGSDSSTDRYVDNMAAVQNALDPQPIVGIRNHAYRNIQEMIWRRVVATRERDGERLRRELTEAEPKGPGTLTLDPDLEMPYYYDAMDVHVQPGSYHRYDLAGHVYHYGSNVFHLGENYGDDLMKNIVAALPTPEDGQVNRVLDLGCTIGRNACFLVDKYEGAEVTGIDLSAATLRYGHRRAVELGKEVHFRQMAAEDLKYPDNHFDVVVSYILFHEIPVETGRKVIEEAHRVLRPGGLFVVADFPSGAPRATTPEGLVAEYERAFDARLNGEPYSYAMTRSDLNDRITNTFSKAFIDDQPFEPLRGARLRVAQK